MFAKLSVFLITAIIGTSAMAKESDGDALASSTTKYLSGADLKSVYSTNGMALPSNSQMRFIQRYVIPEGEHCSQPRSVNKERDSSSCQVCGIGVKGELGFGGSVKYYDINQGGKINVAQGEDLHSNFAFFFDSNGKQFRFSCATSSAAKSFPFNDFTNLVDFLKQAGVDIRALPPKEAKLILPQSQPADGEHD